MFPVPFNRSIAGVTVTINLTFGFAEEMDGSAGIKEWDEHARHGPGSEVTPDRCGLLCAPVRNDSIDSARNKMNK